MKGRKWMIIYILLPIVCIIAAYMIIQALRCNEAVKAKTRSLTDHNEVLLSYGKMSYLDRGEGEVILSVHGIFGGYDQAFNSCEAFANDYRILAPSRFGYLGSDVYGEGSPAEQAKAYVELLDNLGIDKAFVFASSAGGAVAIRFALDFPERCKGLILLSSAMPLSQKPESYSEYDGPPEALCNDYAMFLISPLFEPIMGMEADTIYDMLPIEERKTGVINDAKITNIDMARNYDEYDIEALERPVLILQAKDDKLASYVDTVKALDRFPNVSFVSFDNGGHLMKGHEDEAKSSIYDFIKMNR